MARKRTGEVSQLHSVPPQITKLYAHGIKSVIPLLHGKSPGYEGWQKVSDEEARGKVWDWSSGATGINYGIRLGQQFGGICDIDLDSSESKVLAKYYLPPTSTFGRGGVVTHYLYKQLGKNEPTRKFQWDKRSEKSVLLEFRASGQTMGPGSIHPDSGENIEWMSEDGILEVDGAELIEKVKNLAAASLLLRDWQTGGRDELAVCLIGSMVRAGWDEVDIDSFIEPILVESGDEESVSRLKAGRLAEELRSGGRVPGLKRLREICTGGGLGAAGFERVVEWLELGGGDIIEEINNEYAVVSLRGGGVALMRERSDGEGVEFLDKSSFSLMFANRMAMQGGRQVTADKFWLSHKDRREYLRGVVFKPGQEAGDGEYNLWRGFAVDEVEGEFGTGWEQFLEHLEYEICGGKKEVFEWLIGWMAHRVQRPWEVPESAVVLIGERGDGKSSVFNILGRLFGRHFMTVTNPRHFLGNFNQHLMDKVLVLADEAVWGGDKTNEGVLKVMISESRRIIEIKGKDAFEVENCTAYGICSNNDWVVPVGRMERRFLILRVGGGHRGDLEYWDKMYETMDSSFALGRMLWDLRRWDLGCSSGRAAWRGNRPPTTEELLSQQARGMEHWCQWVIWAIDSGVLVDGGEYWADELYEGYLGWMKKMGWRVDTEIMWSKNLGRMFPDMVKTRGKKEVWTGGYGGGKVSMKKNRLHFGGGVVKAVQRFIVGHADVD